MKILTLLLLFVCGALVGCPSDPSTASADVAADTAEPVRTYALGVTLEAYDPSKNPPWIVDAAPLGSPPRGEVVVVPLYRIGIPWSAFNTPDNVPVEIPAAWQSAFDAMTSTAEATGLPAVLALSPVSPYGDLLTAEATDVNGELALDLQWKGYCYDPTKDGDSERWQRVYAAFAAWAVEHSAVAPDWVQTGSDVTFIERACGRAIYDALAPWYGAAHDAIKLSGSPATTVVGVRVEDLYGVQRGEQSALCHSPFDDSSCLDERIWLLDGVIADRVGLQANAARLTDQGSALPGDWLSRVADRVPRPLTLLSVAMVSRDIPDLDGLCGPLVTSDEVVQRQVLRDALELAGQADVDLLIWDPVVDLLPGAVVGSCPCTGDADVCFHFELLGAKSEDLRISASSGLFEYDGAAKLGGVLWMELLQ